MQEKRRFLLGCASAGRGLGAYQPLSLSSSATLRRSATRLSDKRRRVERSSALANRLRKNFRHFRKWADRQGLTAFRVYDRDLPEYPCSIEWYAGRVHVIEYPRGSSLARGRTAQLHEEVMEAICRVLEVNRQHIHTKEHRRKAWGREQYRLPGGEGERFIVSEQGLKFWVNLAGQLDTGLFLDHRRTRARIRAESAGKRILNAFSYTGAFTVYAAAGGADATTSVDLSKRYLDWGAENLRLNNLQRGAHEQIRADALAWLRSAGAEGRRYDLIVIDPPPFSASKAMRGSFNVQRDHVRLLEDALALLRPGGSLYFSTSFQAFQPRWQFASEASVEELTPASIPEDFSRKRVHRCWRIRQ
jgi:23S rRNA (cytosine1962-C5)-methyltransferase